VTKHTNIKPKDYPNEDEEITDNFE